MSNQTSNQPPVTRWTERHLLDGASQTCLVNGIHWTGERIDPFVDHCVEAVAFARQEGAATGSFNPTVPGLDHLALGVSDLAELERWAAHFDSNAATFSPIEESEFGHHLNVRAPDDIAIELSVLSEAGLAAVGATADQQ